MKTPQSADQKLLIVKKSKAPATKYSKQILMITTKVPKERKIRGKDNNFITGLIKEFTRPNRAPAFTRFKKVTSKVMPEINQAAI